MHRILTFGLFLAGSNVVFGGKFIDPKAEDLDNNKYSVGAALTYLSKAVLKDSLVPGSGNEVGSDLHSASIQDSSDCVKRLVCELQTRFANNAGPLAWDEQLILRAVPSKLDYSSPILQLQLAAQLGFKSGDESQCAVVYSRCLLGAKELIGLMRQRGTSLDIKADDEYECTVLFLWNRKHDNHD